MKKLLLPLSVLLSLSVNAQHTTPVCGFDKVLDYYRRADPSFQQRFDATFKESSRSAAKHTGTVYRIPVVFHVLYNNATQNLPDSVLLNQIQVLNGAYRHNHANVGNIRPIFQPFAADAEIEFYMADVDPQGNFTNGITRTHTDVSRFGDYVNDTSFKPLERIKKTADGGIDPWPSDRYLNIWVADMSDSTYKLVVLYGYATPPTNPLPVNWQGANWPALGDGVVLQYQIVGSNNPYSSMVNYIGTEGRSAVHEVGHYLGLRHIWGDVAGTSDTCGPNGDDGINDTPLQGQESNIAGSCSSYSNKNTCGAGTTGDLPDMWENYMDYSNDKCQAMFTAGQVSHMRNILTNQRLSVTKSLDVKKYKFLEPSFSVYPQPASNTMYVNFYGDIENMQLRDMMGKTVLSFNNEAANAKQYDISGLPTGIYIITLQSKDLTLTKRVMINR